MSLGTVGGGGVGARLASTLEVGLVTTVSKRSASSSCCSATRAEQLWSSCRSASVMSAACGLGWFRERAPTLRSETRAQMGFQLWLVALWS
jgi:hypothetical protein